MLLGGWKYDVPSTRDAVWRLTERTCFAQEKEPEMALVVANFGNLLGRKGVQYGMEVISADAGALTMRKWTMPLTLLGLGGLGYLLLSGRGRQAMRWIAENISRGPDKFIEWNEAAQRELDRIQTALNRVSESLQGGTAQSEL